MKGTEQKYYKIRPKQIIFFLITLYFFFIFLNFHSLFFIPYYVITAKKGSITFHKKETEKVDQF